MLDRSTRRSTFAPALLIAVLAGALAAPATRAADAVPAPAALSPEAAPAAAPAPAPAPAPAQDAQAGGTGPTIPLLPKLVSPSSGPKVDLSDHTTPRRAVRAYLADSRRGNYTSAAKMLDLSSLPTEERAIAGPDLARQLKVVLDQHLWFGDLSAISDAPAGADDDGLAPGVDKIGELPLGGRTLDVLVSRDGDGTGAVWRFADATVLAVPRLYAQHGRPWVEKNLPEVLYRGRFLEIEAWQWIGLAGLVPLAWIVSFLLAWIFHRPLRALASRTASTLDDHLLAVIGPPVRTFVALALFRIGVVWLGLSIPANRAVHIVTGAAVFLAVVWLFVRLINLSGEMLEVRFRTRGPQSMIAVVPLVRRTLKGLLYIIAAIAVLQAFGWKVSGLLAGVGVAGLAISLAAQKTIENLFGGLSLILDQPVRVGDTCKFGAQIGTVEDVGIRSTRLRTVDRTLISVPNAQFSNEIIENYGSRDRIRIYQVLNLRYETTPDQLRALLAELRRLLYAHPMIDPDMACRVRLIGFGPSSLDVEMLAYVKTRDLDEFLAVREDVLLRVMDIVAAAGSGFAFPSQTVYFGRDGGLDDERAREAEARVSRWREEGRLPFPGEDPVEVQKLRDSLDYPPAGSPRAAETGSTGSTGPMGI